MGGARCEVHKVQKVQIRSLKVHKSKRSKRSKRSRRVARILRSVRSGSNVYVDRGLCGLWIVWIVWIVDFLARLCLLACCLDVFTEISDGRIQFCSGPSWSATSRLDPDQPFQSSSVRSFFLDLSTRAVRVEAEADRIG